MGKCSAALGLEGQKGCHRASTTSGVWLWATKVGVPAANQKARMAGQGQGFQIWRGLGGVDKRERMIDFERGATSSGMEDDLKFSHSLQLESEKLRI